MAEVQSRPQRGRTSARGGRGTFGTRGGNQSNRTRINGDGFYEKTKPQEEGELGDLRKQYASELASLKDLFSTWSDEDLLYALRDNGGNLEETAIHITEGSYPLHLPTYQFQILDHFLAEIGFWFRLKDNC